MKINQIVRNLTEEENKPVDPSQVKPGTQVMPSAGETTTKAKKIEKVGPEGATIGTGDSAETKEVVPLTKLVPVEKQQGGQPAVAVAPDNEDIENNQGEDSMKVDELSRMRKLAGMKDKNLEEAPAPANQAAPNPQATAAAKTLDAAIKKFQTAAKLKVDGDIGPQTLNNLNTILNTPQAPAGQAINPETGEVYTPPGAAAPAQPAQQGLMARGLAALRGLMTPTKAPQQLAGPGSNKPMPTTTAQAINPETGDVYTPLSASLENTNAPINESEKIAQLINKLKRIDEAPVQQLAGPGSQGYAARMASMAPQAPAAAQAGSPLLPVAKELDAAIKQFQAAAGLPTGPWNRQHQAKLNSALGIKPAAPAAAPSTPSPGQADQDLANQQVSAQSLPDAGQMAKFNQAMGTGNTPVQSTAPVRPVPKRPAAAPRQAVPQQDYLARMAARDSEAG